MSFPRYPDYKDTGVEWLGEVPAHWSASRFSRVIRAIKDGTHGTFERVATGRPLLSAKNVQDGYVLLSDTESLVKEVDYKSIVSNGFPTKGDLLLTIVGTIGRSCVYEFDYPIAFQRSVCFIRLFPEHEPQFFYYFTQSKFFQEQLASRSKSAAQGGVYMGDVVATCLVHPNSAEQTKIAAFLDRETVKIDELVAEQRRLIELLKEKRQAVISDAVTKGLNPDAPMKPSGIEWLGEVPAHWEVLRGSLIGILFGSEQVPEESVCDEGDLPFIKVGSMSLNSFEIASIDWFVDRAVAHQYKTRSGYIVFPKRGAAIFTNKVNIVECPSMIDPNLMGWEIGEKAIPKFVAYTLKSRKLDELADVSTVPQINNKHIAPEHFPLPPLDEQAAIIKCLDTETAKLDTLTTEAQRAIDLLQERRTALISAAVTGQIDVRALSPTQAIEATT